GLVGVWLLTRLDSDSPRTELLVAMLLIGACMGLSIQVYVIAVQNVVERSVLGAATATITFARQIGGALAVAGLGALMPARLPHELESRLGPAAQRVDPNRLLQAPSGGGRLSSALVGDVQDALAASLHTVFVAMVPLFCVAVVLSVLLRE